MLFLSCWSILVFICLNFAIYFADIQATSWDVTVCFDTANYSSIRVALNNKYVDISYQSKQKCFKPNFELNSGEKPSFIKVNPYNNYETIVGKPDHSEIYFGECKSDCYKKTKLGKWTHWNLEVIHSEMNNKYTQSFKIVPYGKDDIKFEKDSKTSNKSFILPMEMNTRSRIEIETTGKFWLETVVKLKNMETSNTYSCIYVLKQSIPYHECSLINNTVWKIELTFQSKLIGNIEEMKIFFRMTGSETNTLQALTLKKLAYLPTFSAFINIGNISMDEVEISFENNNKAIDISKIVMTRILTGEEYGCVNVHKTNSNEYSCKFLNKKEELQSNESYLLIKIVVGPLVVLILCLIMIFIVRKKVFRNSVNRGNTSKLQDVNENHYYSMQNTTPVCISKRNQELPSSQLKSQDLVEDGYCCMKNPSSVYINKPTQQPFYSDLEIHIYEELA
ncbi:uncharacterized protein LOC115217915 [Octopus sinensis]|uniref:Uncharacterized protein LOC115217915 n=1 Tax=Octopus sinensis TaxID=2607531 RepID=A0A6P7SYK5_9MOLL|nr:uncharacterized protein LOC115217915 [Octopus sinensis]